MSVRDSTSPTAGDPTSPSLRDFTRRLFSDQWQMPIALACGTALLVGYSLHVLVRPDDPSFGDVAFVFHAIGGSLIWISLLLGAIHGVKAAAESIRAREPSIDVLMVVGAALAASIGHPGEGALLLFMFTLAGALEHRALARAKDAVARLSKLMPDEALKRAGSGDNAQWTPVKPEQLQPGDIVLVRPGENVPADGVIVKGRSTIDQSTLTGESLPRPVEAGDDTDEHAKVFAGTLNQSGSLEVRVARPVSESSLTRIMQLVLEAQEQRRPIQRVIDRFEGPYTIGVFAFAFAVLAYFALLHTGPDGQGMSFFDALYRAITLLIVASPCALVIATPTVTLCGINRAARAGLLVKGGDALERLAAVGAIAVDKTGTLTTGRIEVTAVEPLAASDRPLDELLAVALAMEEQSTHPIAAAIVRHCKAREVRPADIDDLQMNAGRGIDALHRGAPAVVGAIEYVAPKLPDAIRRDVETRVQHLRERGAIHAVFALEGDAVVFGLADTVRDGAAQFVHAMHDLGVRPVVMLTGDHRLIAQRMADQLGVDEHFAELLPEQKVEHLRRLRAAHGEPDRDPNDDTALAPRRLTGRRGLAVVGDGANDAPALATADIGIGMGGIGADAALEAADVVILRDNLAIVAWSIRLARRVQLIMLINLVFALAVIITLAAFALVGVIPMGVGVIGHEGSTLIVVANSLQLLAFRGPGGSGE